MTAYYNEIDKNAAAWLRELIKAGAIAPGDVDDRSIVDVTPADLRGYTQHHFFAGIGIWSYALREAGWPDDRPVFTGSPPCQPFSSAGMRKGFDDERHLWPVFYNLIREFGPDVVFGEQVASKGALAWFDPVSTDMEDAKYAFGSLDLCAAGVGAPHIRQRLFFCGTKRMGNANGPRSTPRLSEAVEWQEGHTDVHDDGRGRFLRSGTGESTPLGLAYDEGSGRREERALGGGITAGDRTQGVATGLVDGDSNDWLADAQKSGCTGGTECGRSEWTHQTNGFWSNPDWLGCRDGKWRPVESGTFPLAHGAPARVGRLRGYGNGIVAEVAIEFISAYLDAEAASFDRSPAVCADLAELLG